MLGTLFENTAAQFHTEANYVREGFSGFGQDISDVASSIAGMARSFGAGVDSRLTAAGQSFDRGVETFRATSASTIAGSPALQRGVGGAQNVLAGALGAAGFEPNRAIGGGKYSMMGYGFDVSLDSLGQFELGSSKLSGMQMGTSLLGAGFSAASYGASLYTGGIGGLYDAVVVDVASMYQAQKFGYQESIRYTGAGTTKVFAAKTGFGGKNFRLGGAYIGGIVGQSVGSATGVPMMGTIGAVAGSAIGAAPIRALTANPLMLAGTVATTLAVGGAYTAMKGGAMVIKSTVKHAQAQRRIDTAGSLATFSTQGAYTMRQRAVQAMQKSHMNARSAMGREANLMHQGAMRNYHSRYR
jgi:hypothetical protein